MAYLLPSAETHELTLSPFKRRDIIPLEPNTLWQIKQGMVKTLTWSSSGQVMTLGIWGPGDIVGQPLSQLDPYQIQCLTPVKVHRCPNQDWHQVLNAILSYSRETEALLSLVSLDRIHLRLLEFLGWFGRRFGNEVKEGWLINMPLTHQEISEAIGSTRVSVTRLLKQFEQEAIIIRPKRQLILFRKHYRAQPLADKTSWNCSSSKFNQKSFGVQN